MRVFSSLANVLTPTAVALGNFDGIHQGHQQVICLITNEGHQLGQGVRPTVVTFHPHPQEFFTGQRRTLLTPLPEKIAQLKQIGIEQLVLLPFDRELASLSPKQFVEEILVKGLQAKRVSIGMDFCFGQKRAGTADDLCELAAQHGVDVAIAQLKRLNGGRISSSAIREALQAGNIRHANYLLGRTYSLVGQVVQGQQLGRTLGFPTANLQLPPEKFLPQHGVYAVRASICDRTEELPTTEPTLTGVMNLGYRPTVDGKRLVAETHFFDWSGDLYGKTLIVYLEDFLRTEQKFNSVDELKAQIQLDCEIAQKLLSAVGSPISVPG